MPICLAFLGTTASAQAPINGPLSSAVFEIKNAGFWVDGSISGISGTVVYSASAPTSAQFDVTAQVGTILTGIEARDKHIKEAEYFHAQAYPAIKFRSTGVTVTPQGLSVAGNLTIKNTTKAVVLPVAVAQVGARHTFTARFSIDRRHYGVGGNSWVLGDEVKITVKLVADGLP